MSTCIHDSFQQAILSDTFSWQTLSLCYIKRALNVSYLEKLFEETHDFIFLFINAPSSFSISFQKCTFHSLFQLNLFDRDSFLKIHMTGDRTQGFFCNIQGQGHLGLHDSFYRPEDLLRFTL